MALRLTQARIGYPRLSRLRCHNYHAPRPALHHDTTYSIRSFYTSNRGISHPNRGQQSRLTESRAVRLALLLAAVGLFYNISLRTPLRLESSDDELPGSEHIKQRYFSPITPCTIQQANEVLRWEEGSQIVGLGSGVQRVDSVRIASNMPCEDQMVAAVSSPEDNKIRWLVNSSISANDISLMPSFYLG